MHLLMPQPRSRRTAPQAYELYVCANSLARSQGSDPAEAFALTRRVLDIDPTYVPALTLQSHILFGTSETERASWPGANGLTNTITTARALVDPDDAVANAYKGFELFVHDGELADDARHFNRALARAPQDIEVLRAGAVVARLVWRFDEAIALGELAAERDPLCRVCRSTLFVTAYAAGDFKRAEKYTDVHDRPAGTGSRYYARVLIAAGRYESRCRSALNGPKVTTKPADV